MTDDKEIFEERGTTIATRNAKRREPKALRREQLINATIDSLARRGYSATTLADVADGAGLSRGIVNFHFTSKDNLLLETLQYLIDEYSANWKVRLEAAGDSVAAGMQALVKADLDRRICTPRKVAAWFALMIEAKSKPNYNKVIWDRDLEYRRHLEAFCRRLKEEGDYAYDPENMAVALYAMQEGLWLRIMLTGRNFKREAALDIALEALGNCFPRHFGPDGSLLENTKT